MSGGESSSLAVACFAFLARSFRVPSALRVYTRIGGRCIVLRLLECLFHPLTLAFALLFLSRAVSVVGGLAFLRLVCAATG